MKKIIVIGSGMGGLSTAAILVKRGFDVTVLEQNQVAGGCLQCFSRRGVKFETGMHFIGSCDRGQMLDTLLDYLGIRDKLTLSRLDTSGYDVIGLRDERFSFANSREAFIEQLSQRFPDQRDNLRRYYDLVDKVAEASSLRSFDAATDTASTAITTEYQLRSINSVISSIITDEKLASVLVGNSPLYAGVKDRTPFATHAYITDFYNQSAFRVVGGSENIARELIKVIESAGGKVRTSARVSRIVSDYSGVTGVEVDGEEFIPADIVISAIHPQATMRLTDSHLLRAAFRRRMASMPQTVGAFAIYMHFKAGAIAYNNFNYYGFEQSTPWGCETYTAADWPKGFIYMHFCDSDRPRYATAGVLISYMHWDEVSRWADTTVERRGEDYRDFKQRHAERLLDTADRHFPGLKAGIEHYYTSTPLTYRDYTSTEQGGMYGIMRDVSADAATHVPTRTRLPGLLLTGQNVNSHGILGVIVGALLTCAEIVPVQEIFNDIKSHTRQ